MLGGRALLSPALVRAELSGAAAVLAARPALAALNGLGFYTQLQLSFVCLSRMSACLSKPSPTPSPKPSPHPRSPPVGAAKGWGQNGA